MVERGIQLKSRGELQAMRASGRVLAAAIAAGRAAVAPGVSTLDIDAAVASVIAEAGATSNFLHYGAHGSDPGFPATICASVNSEVVHGIPRATTILREGDLLSIDAGCILDGWHSDSAISLHVGEPPSMEEVDLIAACDLAMWAGIAAARAGGRLGDVSFAIESSVNAVGQKRRPAVRTRPGLRRARDRHRHAHGAVRAEPGQTGQGSTAGAGYRTGDRADDHPRPSGHPRAPRWLDGGHPGRWSRRAHRTFHRDQRRRHLSC